LKWIKLQLSVIPYVKGSKHECAVTFLAFTIVHVHQKVNLLVKILVGLLFVKSRRSVDHPKPELGNFFFHLKSHLGCFCMEPSYIEL